MSACRVSNVLLHLVIDDFPITARPTHFVPCGFFPSGHNRHFIALFTVVIKVVLDPSVLLHLFLVTGAKIRLLLIEVKWMRTSDHGHHEVI